MKKLWAILLATMMLLSVLPVNAIAQTVTEDDVQIIESGSCGDDMIWTLYANGLLEISGTGEMANWNFFDVSAPWIYRSEEIKRVVISEGVTSIGQNAFCSEDSYFDYNDHFYSALTEIVIPSTVTTVQTNGISGLDILETITIPASLTTLVGAAFNNNYALKNYIVDDENPVFKSVNGVLFSKDGKTLVSYPIGSKAESYIVPDGTETIAAYAFSQCSPMLKEVVFNNELTFIDDEAFQNCDGLEKIELPDSLKELGGGVFQECSALAEIDLPEGMTRIGGRAFDATAYYNDWSNWEDTVLYIGPYLLETTYVTPELDWEEWKEKSGTLVVRAGTTLIADESVDSSSVNAVVFNSELQHIGFAAFCWLDIASVSLPNSLVSLGDWAFYSCELLSDIHMGSNLQYIGHEPFGMTPYDTPENYVDGVLYYGPYVLGFNDDLPKDVVLREGTTLIAERAFWKEDGRLDSPDYGAGMETITFPETLTTICDGAFYSCNNLKTLTIPSTVTYIGDQAYGWVKGYDYDIDEETFGKMTDVTIKGYNNTEAQAYADRNGIPFVSLDVNHVYDGDCDAKCNVCGSVRDIAEAVFKKYYTYSVSNGEAIITAVNKSISGDIIIPATLGGCPVTSIGVEAFFCCYDITSVAIPDSVTNIGSYAFAYCNKLTSVTIPESVTSMGDCALYNCTKLTSIIVDSKSKYYEFKGNCLIEKTTKTLILGLENSVIPNDGSVTSIASYAFCNCSGLESITIPDSVTSIGDTVFYNCDSLTSITIPDSVTSMGDMVFSNCSGLENVKISNNVTSIGGGAFEDCSSLTSIIIPDSVTSIGVCAFYNCASLESVTIGNNVTSIAKDAFKGCSRLKSITIPDSVTSIGTSAFRSCISLENVTIGNGVSSISSYAFAYCEGLTSIIIPDSVTNIGNYTFDGCSNLSDVYYLGNTAQKKEIAIGNNNAALLNANWHYEYCIDGADHTFENDCDIKCDRCGYTREVEHIYSNDCDAKCNVCGGIRSVKHTYSSDCDTVCNVCGDIRSESTEHLYENTCDTDCNVCGATREIAHNYSIRKYDDDQHWFECECGAVDEKNIYGHGWSRNFDENEHWLECECGHKTDFGTHDFSIPNSDENYHWNECTCGFAKESGFEKHEFMMYYDDNTHWLECDCFYKKNTENHTYSNDMDPDCDVCLATREITFSGWFSDSGKWYFYENGNKVVGSWKKDSKGWVYLGADGAMKTNAWAKDTNGWCYVGADGYCVTNKWMQDSTKKWCYLNAVGNMVVNNWLNDGGKWYFLDANGYMVSNSWKKDSNGWVYLGASGAMMTNSWAKDSYGWCFVGADGYAVTNTWKRDSNGWCYLGASGSQVKNNWVWDGAWYYIDADGYMLSNTSKWIKDKTYKFNASGVCTNP